MVQPFDSGVNPKTGLGGKCEDDEKSDEQFGVLDRDVLGPNHGSIRDSANLDPIEQLKSEEGGPAAKPDREKCTFNRASKGE